MGRHSKQNNRIEATIDALAKADGEVIDLNGVDVRYLRGLIGACIVRDPHRAMTHNQWQAYRVFESCAHKSRLDAAGREQRLSAKWNYEELRASIAEPPMLAVATAVDPRMIDSAHGLMIRRERFGRMRGRRRPAMSRC
jgi:hypothetical protein